MRQTLTRPGRRRHLAALAFAGLTATALPFVGSTAATAKTPPPPPPPTAFPMTTVGAASAGHFVDSVGVNAHLGYANTPYLDVNAVQSALQQLDVRHIRVGLGTTINRSMVSALNQLHAAGIMASATVGSIGVPMGQPLTAPATTVNAIKASGIIPDLEGIEGPNEWDLHHRTNWAAEDRTYQTQLYSLVHSDPSFAGMPVLAPSIGGFRDFSTLGSLAGSADFGNMHSYPNARSVDVRLKSVQMAGAALVSGNQPVIATETGLTDALNNLTTGTIPTTDAVAAAYLPRLLATYAQAGVTRTYFYELAEETPDPGLTNLRSDFGLMHTDWTPKPQFTAVSRLLHLLDDYGNLNYTPGSLTYQVDSPTTGIQNYLLERSDGTFYLFLWRNLQLDRTSNDPLSEITDADATVTLQDPSATVSYYRPTLSGDPTAVSVGSNGSFDVPVNGDLTVVAIQPSAAASSTRH